MVAVSFKKKIIKKKIKPSSGLKHVGIWILPGIKLICVMPLFLEGNISLAQLLPFILHFLFFFFQAEDGIRDLYVTGVQTCALPIWPRGTWRGSRRRCRPARAGA